MGWGQRSSCGAKPCSQMSGTSGGTPRERRNFKHALCWVRDSCATHRKFWQDWQPSFGSLRTRWLPSTTVVAYLNSKSHSVPLGSCAPNSLEPLFSAWCLADMQETKSYPHHSIEITHEAGRPEMRENAERAETQTVCGSIETVEQSRFKFRGHSDVPRLCRFLRS